MLSLAFCVAIFFPSECEPAKAFREAVDGSGRRLCAAGGADELQSVDELKTVHGAIIASTALPQVHCAWRCTYHDLCHSFNYRTVTDGAQCEFYFSRPIACQDQTNCTYFEVNFQLKPPTMQ